MFLKSASHFKIVGLFFTAASITVCTILLLDEGDILQERPFITISFMKPQGLKGVARVGMGLLNLQEYLNKGLFG